MSQSQLLTHNLSPVERLLFNFIYKEGSRTLQEVMKFRGKDEAHTHRVLNRLIWYKLITKSGKGKEKVVKINKRKVK